MQKYQNNVTSRTGDAVSGAAVAVRVSGGALATIYSDDGVTPAANPITSDSLGYFEFYAPDGTYDIVINGVTTYTDVLLADGVAMGVDLSSTTDAAKGTALVGFRTVKTGASGRVLATKLEELPSLGDFTSGTAAVAALTTSDGGGTLRLPPGNGAAVMPADTGKVLLDYDGPDVNFSSYGEAPSTAWSAAKVLRYQNNTTHNAKGQSAFAIESTVVGSGTNGPTHADYGQSISLIKKDFSTTSVVGELDTLALNLRNGGTGDGCGILINAAHYGSGFTGAFEASTNAIAGGSITQGVQIAGGVVDSGAGNQYGYTAVKTTGIGGHAFYAGDTGIAQWTNFLRLSYQARNVFDVSNDGQLTMMGGTGTTVTKTLRVSNGVFAILNAAKTIEVLALSDAGNLGVTGAFASATAAITGAASAASFAALGPGAAGTIGATGAISGASLAATGPGGAGTIAATGAITGASVAATGAVSGATVAATAGVTGASVAATGAVTGATVGATSTILSSGATAGIGYTTGAGGTVTQITSKATGVTINKMCGNIVTSNASLAGGAVVAFTVTNSALGANDFVECKRASGGTAASYFVDTDSMGAGSFVVYIQNITAGALAEAITLRFTITKGAIS